MSGTVLNKTKEYLDVAVPNAMEIVTRTGTVTMATVNDVVHGTAQAVSGTVGSTLSQINKYTPDIYDVGAYGQKDLSSDAGMFIAGNSAMVAQNAVRMARVPTKYVYGLANWALYTDHKPITVFGHQLTQGYRMSRAKNMSKQLFQSNSLSKLHYSEILVGKSRNDVWGWQDRLAWNRFSNNAAWGIGRDAKMNAMRTRFKANRYNRMKMRSKRLDRRYKKLKDTQFNPLRSTSRMMHNQSRKLMNQVVSGNDPNALSTKYMHIMQKGLRVGLKTPRQMWKRRKQIARFLENSWHFIRHPLLSIQNVGRAIVGVITSIISAIVGIISSIPVIVSILAVIIPIIIVISVVTVVITSFVSIISEMSGRVDPSVVANREYALNAFIYEAKARNWKEEAIIGTMAYIMQEGGSMGTFTYESYWLHTGAGGVVNDVTMDNDAWESWLNHEGLSQAHATYASNGSSYYAAIGIGLLGDSDVWNYSGSKEATNATSLIAYANQRNRPWQDPETQLSYIFDVKFSNPTAFDTYGVNPTTDERSADEWCRRVVAGIGMPAWSWTDNNNEMYRHTVHIANATNFYNNYKGFTYSYLIGGEGSIDGDPNFSNTEAWITKNPYAPSYYGQCTWFAWGRFYEIYGYSPNFTGNGSMCVGQLLASHPDKFKFSRTPVVGAVFSTGGGGSNTNHVGIVTGISANNITVQEGNLNGVTDSWSVAITDWWTHSYDLQSFNAIYDPIYAVPIN